MMGDAADYYKEQGVGIDRPEMDAKHWVTKEGERIAVKKMTDSHLVNTIRWLRRNAESIQLGALLELEGGLSIMNPETMVAYGLEQEASHVATLDPEDYLYDAIPCYETMLEEAEKRKLNIE